jgi:RNA polymerase sigma-70 factor (ECF subfamily)
MHDRSDRDEVLAALAREGDAGAFEELFNRYRKPIVNFIYRMIGNRETAEEVALEVFMKAYNNLGIFDPKKKFSTWLYTIAKNLARNAIRDRKYFRDISLEEPVAGADEKMRLVDVIADPNAGPDAIIESEELSAEAQRVLDEMPEEYREVVTLCSIQGMAYREAAAIIGCSIATVSIRLEKARAWFMKRLGIDMGRERGGDAA